MLEMTLYTLPTLGANDGFNEDEIGCKRRHDAGDNPTVDDIYGGYVAIIQDMSSSERGSVLKKKRRDRYH